MAQKTSEKIRSLPTERTVIYPESDGKPMAETDIHRKLMVEIIEILDTRFENRPDVYVSGNLMLYYEKGQPKRWVAPDVFVVFGIKKGDRRTYRLWEEGVSPNFVLELASKTTYQNDLGDKKDLYADELGVQEYYLYDPDRQYLPSPLMGYHLVDGDYTPIQPIEHRLPSEMLGLELGEVAGKLRLYDPEKKAWLMRPAEAAEARARQETQARQQAEAELARLRAELERLRAADE